jgi:putative hydrolase of the HAD superfamily
LIWDVFINLDKQAVNSLRNLGLSGWHEDLDQLNIQFETGQISREAFIEGLSKFIPMRADDFTGMECHLLISFVSIEFLQMLSTKYRFILLSNTDASISKHSNKKWSHFFIVFTTALKSLFLLEIGMKAKPEIYKYVLNEHDLQAKRTLFIDDKRKY